MPTEHVIFEDDQIQVIETVSDINPDSKGGWRSTRTINKPGSPAKNRDDTLVEARTALAVNRAKIAAAKPGTAALQASAAYDNSILAFEQINGLIHELLQDYADVSDT